MEVTVRINTSTPAGRKAVRELENKKYAQIEYPLPDAIAEQECTPLDEVIEAGWDRLSEHYQVDMRNL